ncbi:Cytochrome P450 monooxygenase [Exophiala dermatitidis]
MIPANNQPASCLPSAVGHLGRRSGRPQGIRQEVRELPITSSMFEQVLARLQGSPISYLSCISAVLIVSRLLFNKYGHGINHIPGPALAAYTDLWRLFLVWGRRPEAEHIRLHEIHGPLVRLGPKAISVSDPAAIQIIYALNSGFVKSGFYPVQQTIAKGRRLYTLFTSTDEKFHAKLRRAVSSAYAMSTLVQFEPLVDSTTSAFLDQLQKRFADRPGPDGVCDFGTWLQYYAFDVIGELTYSQRLGFVDQGVDVDNIIGDLEKLLNYVSVVGQMPELDNIFLKNPLLLMASKHGLLNSNTPVANFARARIASRPYAAEVGDKSAEPFNGRPGRRDFLSRFYEAHRKDPEFITQERVLALTVANMFAGSDTTAITLRAIFYNLLRNPDDMESLMQELWSQKEKGLFTNEEGLVEWSVVKDLPFLGAVIKESLRCHPAAALTLERIVPPGGVTICGQVIPGGTIVGCNAWTVHRHPLFGDHTDQFRPRRWLEAGPEQRRLMENSIFSFGAGSRTCIGKNVSLLELYKLVPAVLMRFEIELADPSKEWKLHNAWFLKQSDFNVRLKSRKRQG